MRSAFVLALLAAAVALCAQPARERSYLGFDRNIYPGDEALPILRKTFSFASYWLSPPPGETTNTWSGKRDILKKNGFGFVVLFRGKVDDDLQSIEDAADKGESDARETVGAAHREGFSAQTVIYLDIEEGGRLSLKYHKYMISWLLHVTPSFRSGFYCSAIPVNEGAAKTITACEDILNDLSSRSREFSIWAYNDFCPPSPGCAFPENPPPPATAGRRFCTSCIDIWQFAQSPRRKEFTAHCPPGYAKDNNCYAPGDGTHRWHLDLNTATSPDPSAGAK